MKQQFKAFHLFSALPKHDPIITGLKHFYEFGELVSANCTSDMSSPPASITWYLNDEKASFTNQLCTFIQVCQISICLQTSQNLSKYFLIWFLEMNLCMNIIW